MQQNSGQSSPKQRRKTKTNDQEPLPLLYNPKVGKVVSSSKITDTYPIDDKALEPPRYNTSAIRWDTTHSESTPQTTGIVSPSTTSVPSRRQPGTRKLPPPQRQVRATSPRPEPPKDRKNVHWLLPLGVGMVAMLVLWTVGSTVLAWGIQRYNDVRYGVPRTYQTDAMVGHGGDNQTHPSHFMAVNLNHQAVIIEFMAGDPAKSINYVAPILSVGPGSDLAPITLDFRDVTGDGKVDMIVDIHLQTQDQISVFINDGTKFRPSNGNDKIHI